jgi:hypothetical protein
VSRCLPFFAHQLSLEMTDFGATCYRHYGWASEQDIPLVQTVRQLKQFLSEAGDIGLYTLKVTIAGAVILECCQDAVSVQFNIRSQCMAFIKALLPDGQQNRVIDALLQHPHCFIHSGVKGEIKRYASIDAFQAKHG